jgi:hypothetical protein
MLRPWAGQGIHQKSRQSEATLDVKIPRSPGEHGENFLNKCSGIIIREEKAPKDPSRLQ